VRECQCRRELAHRKDREQLGCSKNAHDDGRDEHGDARLDDLGRDALEPADVRRRVAVVDAEVDAVRAVDMPSKPDLLFRSARQRRHIKERRTRDCFRRG
jgi:hypothetical protein